MRHNDLYIQLYSSSPSPKRDYNGLTITSEHITLNSWDISHGPHVFPKKLRTPLTELEEDEVLQRDIKNLFGAHVLDYALQVSRGEHKLHTLPNQLFLAILRLLAANDIIRLGQTSKIFFELCNANPVWKILYRKRSLKSITNQELSQAEKQSWKYLLKKKLLSKFALIGVTESFKKSKSIKPSQKMLDEMDFYSKPIVHKTRPPPSDTVPKLDIDIDFKSLKVQSENMPKVQKKTVTIQSPKPENPFRVDLARSPISKNSSPKWTSSMENSSKSKGGSGSLNRGLSSPSLKSESPKNEKSPIKKRDVDAGIRKASPKCQSPNLGTSSPNLTETKYKVKSEHLLRSPKIDSTKISRSSPKLESPNSESPKKSSQKTRTKFTMLN